MNTPGTESDTLPVNVLAETENLYREAAEQLSRALIDVRAGKFGEIKTVVGAVKDLKAAFQLVQEERGRVGKLVKHSTGVVPDHVLDFHAARDEIGRRLACLRDAGGH